MKYSRRHSTSSKETEAAKQRRVLIVFGTDDQEWVQGLSEEDAAWGVTAFYIVVSRANVFSKLKSMQRSYCSVVFAAAHGCEGSEAGMFLGCWKKTLILKGKDLVQVMKQCVRIASRIVLANKPSRSPPSLVCTAVEGII